MMVLGALMKQAQAMQSIRTWVWPARSAPFRPTSITCRPSGLNSTLPPAGTSTSPTMLMELTPFLLSDRCIMAEPAQGQSMPTSLSAALPWFSLVR